jgi:hypothetical protein
MASALIMLFSVKKGAHGGDETASRCRQYFQHFPGHGPNLSRWPPIANPPPRRRTECRAAPLGISTGRLAIEKINRFGNIFQLGGTK